MFNSKGPTSMISNFMCDYSLKDVAKIIVVVSEPLEASYYATLEAVSEGWPSQAAFAARRCVGGFLETVQGVLQTLDKAGLSDILGFTKPTRRDLPDVLPDWAACETTLLEKASTFGVCLAGNVFWSNVHYWMALPGLVAGLLSKKEEQREACMAQCKSIVQAVLAAEAHKTQHAESSFALLFFVSD